MLIVCLAIWALIILACSLTLGVTCSSLIAAASPLLAVMLSDARQRPDDRTRRWLVCRPQCFFFNIGPSRST